MLNSNNEATAETVPEQRMRYNGKELHTELGLGWVDYGARMYEPSMGRWNGVDALAEDYPGWSSFNYTLNNPVYFVDPDGRRPWPGVTILFTETEIGAGLGYGWNFVYQRGIAFDEIGKTKFRAESELFIVNQDLEEGSRNPQIVIGASLSSTVGITQNWKADVFSDLFDSPSSMSLPIDAARLGALATAGIGLNKDSFTFQFGVGAGIKMSVLSTEIIESVSLTNAEASEVRSIAQSNSPWIVSDNVTPEYDSQGKITRFVSTIMVKVPGVRRDKIVDTGVRIYSSVVENEDGIVPSNQWRSEDYQRELEKNQQQQEQ